MPITETEARHAVESAGFAGTHETKKVVEYTSARSGRECYLRLGQGFPRHADLVINPEVPSSSLLSIPGITANSKVEFRFGSNMHSFPKALNEGQEPEHYGRALQASSAEALAALCRDYALIP